MTNLTAAALVLVGATVPATPGAKNADSGGAKPR